MKIKPRSPSAHRRAPSRVGPASTRERRPERGRCGGSMRAGRAGGGSAPPPRACTLAPLPRAPPGQRRHSRGCATSALRFAPGLSPSGHRGRPGSAGGKEAAAARGVWSGIAWAPTAVVARAGPGPRAGPRGVRVARDGARPAGLAAVRSPRRRSPLFLFLFRRRARAGLPARGAAPLVAHFGRARPPLRPAVLLAGEDWGARRRRLGSEGPAQRDEGLGRDSPGPQVALWPPGARGGGQLLFPLPASVPPPSPSPLPTAA